MKLRRASCFAADLPLPLRNSLNLLAPLHAYIRAKCLNLLDRGGKMGLNALANLPEASGDPPMRGHARGIIAMGGR